MRLTLDPALAVGYRSAAQRARRMTEGWFANEMYCVCCGANALQPHKNNTHANDFFCEECGSNFELKSGMRPPGDRIPDGAYATMMQRLELRDGGPHLAMMHYSADTLSVCNLFVVPSRYLTKEMIQQRRPLSGAADRAGWIGCNIRIGEVPASGRVQVVQDGTPLPKTCVLRSLRRAANIKGSLVDRTWLVDTLRCIEPWARSSPCRTSMLSKQSSRDVIRATAMFAPSCGNRCSGFAMPALFSSSATATIDRRIADWQSRGFAAK